jgi:hypothetical protein
MRATRTSAVLAIWILGAGVASAQTGVDSFTATATLKHGNARASAPVTVTITRYASADEREVVVKALREHGSAAVRQALSSLSEAGVIEVGSARTPLKFAAQRPTGSGRLITLVAAEPILFLGGGLPSAAPREGFDVAVAMLDVNGDGHGLGELAPAAKVGLDANGALLIEDYGATVIWLQGLARVE